MTSAYCTSTKWGFREGGEDEAEGEQAENLARTEAAPHPQAVATEAGAQRGGEEAEG